jgi:hypothetical protein
VLAVLAALAVERKRKSLSMESDFGNCQ